MQKTTGQTNMLDYFVMCIHEFAYKHNIPIKSAFTYLYQYGAIAFLQEHYEIEHTLGLEDALEDMQAICEKNGGRL